MLTRIPIRQATLRLKPPIMESASIVQAHISNTCLFEIAILKNTATLNVLLLFFPFLFPFFSFSRCFYNLRCSCPRPLLKYHKITNTSLGIRDTYHEVHQAWTTDPRNCALLLEVKMWATVGAMCDVLLG